MNRYRALGIAVIVYRVLGFLALIFGTILVIWWAANTSTTPTERLLYSVPPGELPPEFYSMMNQSVITRFFQTFCLSMIPVLLFALGLFVVSDVLKWLINADQSLRGIGALLQRQQVGNGEESPRRRNMWEDD